MDDELKRETEAYLELEQKPEHTAYIRQLVADKAWDELERRMRPRLEFGTAGLRAAMGAGLARMNELTVIQATQGVCAHLLSSGDIKQGNLK